MRGRALSAMVNITLAHQPSPREHREPLNTRITGLRVQQTQGTQIAGMPHLETSLKRLCRKESTREVKRKPVSNLPQIHMQD